MTWAIPFTVPYQRCGRSNWEHKVPGYNMNTSVSQDVRMLFSAGLMFHILSASQLYVRPRCINLIPALLYQNSWAPAGPINQMIKRSALWDTCSAVIFFFPISLSCKHTPGLPSCAENYCWWKYPENYTFPKEKQFGLISFYMVKIIYCKVHILCAYVGLVALLRDTYWGIWIIALLPPLCLVSFLLCRDHLLPHSYCAFSDSVVKSIISYHRLWYECS